MEFGEQIFGSLIGKGLFMAFSCPNLDLHEPEISQGYIGSSLLGDGSLDHLASKWDKEIGRNFYKMDGNITQIIRRY